MKLWGFWMRHHLRHVINIGTYHFATTQVWAISRLISTFIWPGVFLLFPYSTGYAFSGVPSESLENLSETLFIGKPHTLHFSSPVLCLCCKRHLNLHLFTSMFYIAFLYLHCLWIGEYLEKNMCRAHLLDLRFPEGSCITNLDCLRSFGLLDFTY